MAKPHREKDKFKTGGGGGERRVLIGLIWNCATELKLILTALLLLCSLATLLQFFPTRFFPFYSNVLPPCHSTGVVSKHIINAHITTTVPTPVPPPAKLEEVLDSGVVKRSFNPVGTAAYNFILMSAYRGGPNTFAVMGLSSKSLHVFGHPVYTCEYHSNNDTTVIASVRGRKILPDWGYGRVYTTVVINCTFPDNSPAVTDSASGGQLTVHASPNGGYDTKLKTTADTILALDEPPASWNKSKYEDTTTKYDYLYCGSPLYGTLSPQRVREWIAYHVRLFGGRSHFVIHDAGGVHGEVLEVLLPWIELGYVTLQDVREQERFDAYYHNQFLIVNDCLHRYRFDAKWMFFFDIDEFIYLPGVDGFGSVMDSLSEYTMFTIEQIPMSNKLCLIEDARQITKKWGFEKLVYKNMKRVTRKDRKYAIQPRNVFATGVHISQNYQGNYRYLTSDLMKYYHYHGTIAQRREPCQQFINDTSTVEDGIPFVRDMKMKYIASLVKSFELETIGSRLRSTRQ